MMQTQPFEISKFSGGITDNYVEGQAHRAKEMDNIFLTNNEKPYSRYGSELLDISNPQVPNGMQRINSLIVFKEESLLVNSLRKVYDFTTGFTPLLGPSGNDVLSDGDALSNTSFSFWNDQVLITNDAYSLPMKIYKDDLSVLQVRSAGLPELASDPNIVVGTVGSFRYLYAFAYYYEYKSGAKTFLDIGAVTQVQVLNSEEPSISANSINSIPVLTNSSGENYDTANIKVKIYRTVADGEVLYEIGEVANGVTTFNDSNSDVSIQTNVPIYTTGGVLDNDSPPRCKYVHVTNSLGLYANTKVGSEIYNNRIIMSVYNDVDSTPVGNFIDVDDEITGISSVEHIPVVFCKKHIYRIDGFYSETGGGDPLHQRISDTAGCISNTSIVQTTYGTFFAGNDGFYWTDSFKVLKISDEFDIRYRSFIANNKRIYGIFDEENSRVIWSIQKDIGSADIDSCFALDLRFGVKRDSCFTTLSGGESFSPTAMAMFNKELIRADRRGYLFRHSESILTDKKIEIGIDPTLWNDQTIIWDYESCAFNFGTTFMRKWITRVNAILQNETNLSLAIFSINDDGRRTSELAPIRFRGNVTWGDEDVVWGDASVIWNYDGFIDEYRRFPAKGLRCNYKQVRFTNAFVVTHNSDSYGAAAVNSSAKVATISGDWPTSAVDYKIFFANDNYTRGFDITNVSSSTLTYADIEDYSITGSHDWIIKGYPKGEVFNLITYVLHYSTMGKTQQGFRSSGSGSNA